MALSVSQEELAFRAGVDRTFVSRIERGIRQPTITTIFLLSQALELPASELVRDAELFAQSKYRYKWFRLARCLFLQALHVSSKIDVSAV